MKAIISLLVSLILITACSSEPADDSGIALNNGEKWEVNAEMRPHVIDGERALNAYLAEGTEDHKALAVKLKAHNDKLIQSCTMQGASHDELHKWLHPHLQLVKKLTEADAESAPSVIDELKHSYSIYHRYFN